MTPTDAYTLTYCHRRAGHAAIPFQVIEKFVVENAEREDGELAPIRIQAKGIRRHEEGEQRLTDPIFGGGTIDDIRSGFGEGGGKDLQPMLGPWPIYRFEVQNLPLLWVRYRAHDRFQNVFDRVCAVRIRSPFEISRMRS